MRRIGKLDRQHLSGAGSDKGEVAEAATPGRADIARPRREARELRHDRAMMARILRGGYRFGHAPGRPADR
jgi:hypothetical protein